LLKTKFDLYSSFKNVSHGNGQGRLKLIVSLPTGMPVAKQWVMREELIEQFFSPKKQIC
jgi:hypothetical protein